MYAKLNAKQQDKASAASRHAAVYRLYASLTPYSKSEIRCYQAGKPIFARATLEYPGDFSHWKFYPAGDEEGVFKIENVALRRFICVDDCEKLIVGKDREATPAEFRVQPAEDGLVQIKQSNADNVWGISGDSPIYGEVVLEAANGSDKQKFDQVSAYD